LSISNRFYNGQEQVVNEIIHVVAAGAAPQEETGAAVQLGVQRLLTCGIPITDLRDDPSPFLWRPSVCQDSDSPRRASSVMAGLLHPMLHPVAHTQIAASVSDPHLQTDSFAWASMQPRQLLRRRSRSAVPQTAQDLADGGDPSSDRQFRTSCRTAPAAATVLAAQRYKQRGNRRMQRPSRADGQFRRVSIQPPRLLQSLLARRIGANGAASGECSRSSCADRQFIRRACRCRSAAPVRAASARTAPHLPNVSALRPRRTVPRRMFSHASAQAAQQRAGELAEIHRS
jgi:hypothetical protein